MAKRFELASQYTEKYRDKLHPCKYCGNTDIRIVLGRARISSNRTDFCGTKNVWSVVCSTLYCDCTGEYDSVKEAVDVWNKKH